MGKSTHCKLEHPSYTISPDCWYNHRGDSVIIEGVTEFIAGNHRENFFLH